MGLRILILNIPEMQWRIHEEMMRDSGYQKPHEIEKNEVYVSELINF